MYHANAKFIDDNKEWTTTICRSYNTADEALSAAHSFWAKYINHGCQYVWIEEV